MTVNNIHTYYFTLKSKTKNIKGVFLSFLLLFTINYTFSQKVPVVFYTVNSSYNEISEPDSIAYAEATYYLHRGIPGVAVRKLFGLLQYVEKDSKLYFKVQISLADAYRQLRELKKGYSILYSVIDNPNIGSEELAYAYTRIAAIFNQGRSEVPHHRDSTFKYSNLALSISEENGYDFHAATAKNEIGYLLKEKGNYEEGMLLLEDAMILFRNEKMYLHMSNVAINISSSYMFLEQYQKAEEVIDSAMLYCDQSIDQYMLMRLYLHKSKLRRLQGLFEESLTLQEKARKMQVSFYQSLIDVEITEMAAKYDLDIKEAKILEEQQKSELRKRDIIILTTAIVILLIIFSVSIVIYRLKRKNLLQKQDITKMKAEMLEIDFKNKNMELSNAIADVVSYNKILESVKKAIKQESFNEAITILNSNINTEQNWQNFLLNFNQNYPDFFSKLKNVYPNLTENDVKLCALLRMGFKSKEISGILNVALSSVKKSRQRLRKKLNIEDKAGFADIFDQL